MNTARRDSGRNAGSIACQIIANKRGKCVDPECTQYPHRSDGRKHGFYANGSSRMMVSSRSAPVATIARRHPDSSSTERR